MASQPSFISKCIKGLDLKPKPKGFAFTTDAVLAVILFISTITALGYVGLFEPTPPFTNLEIKRNMEASLEILDRNSTLQAMNATTISKELKEMLPQRVGWRLTIEKFVPSGSSFNKIGGISAGNWSTDLNEVNFVQGQRLFLDFNSTDVTGFFEARWRAWRK